jgi:hypothetical protein
MRVMSAVVREAGYVRFAIGKGARADWPKNRAERIRDGSSARSTRALNLGSVDAGPSAVAVRVALRISMFAAASHVPVPRQVMIPGTPASYFIIFIAR